MRYRYLGFLLMAGMSPAAQQFRLMHQPAVSATQLAFVYGDDLWTVSRKGGEAIRLTTDRGPVSDPAFSPDGSWIAFTANFGGNTDVYAIPASGREPRRLTFHPGADTVGGWTPDGRRILFRSGRRQYMGFDRLYTMPLTGGFAEEVPVPMAEEGSYSPDGRRLAYVPLRRAFETWKHYRGGRTTPVWIADLATSRIEKIPRENSNDFQPMWRGDIVYFLSDRDGAATLFSYDTKTRRVKQLLDNRGLDIYSASIGPDAIAYEQFGSLHLFDLKSGRSEPVEITLPHADFAAIHPHAVKVVDSVENVSLSSTGVALFEAHGEIFQADGAGVRNLTNTPGIAERDPAWSPDGRRIAYFSDESGEYALHIRPGRTITLGDLPSFYYAPTWSPDGQKLAYFDKHLTLWFVDAAAGAPVKIDTDSYGGGYRIRKLRNPVWSPDSRAIAYTKERKNNLRALFLYSLDTAKTQQITDGMSDVRYPAFDPGGRYLYFTSSTDLGPSGGKREVYRALLGSEGIVPVPAPVRNYVGLEIGQDGAAYLIENAGGGETIYKLNPADGKTEKLLEGVAHFTISSDGRRRLFQSGGRWMLDESALKLGGLEMPFDPRQEWKQIYHEALRIERDFFYDPALRGFDLKQAERRFAPYVDKLVSRADLNYILREILGNLSVSHLTVSGGDRRTERIERVGLLGADYSVEHGRYRFARIYTGEHWNSARKAPLAQPGATVHDGEYLLAVNGRQLQGTDNIYGAFEDLAGKMVSLTVAPDPTGSNAREVSVKTIYPLGEFFLRYWAWIEDNRKLVDRLSSGRVGYLHLPNTDDDGHRNFDRYFFSQQDKEALIVDNRFNNGGSQPAEYFMDYLQRRLWHFVSSRDSGDRTAPGAGVFGPKVMLVNEYSSSGGDALAYYFRQSGLGPVIGKRTWGGLIGTHRVPRLIDGGEVTAPDLASWIKPGEWLLENRGMAPDQEVEFDPASWRQGRDPQLEAAVTAALNLLRETSRSGSPRGR